MDVSDIHYKSKSCFFFASNSSCVTTTKLVAWLCKKHSLDPGMDVYAHKYFYARKQCPQYILSHCNTFLSTEQKYYNTLTGKTITPETETEGRTYTVKHGDTLLQIAQTHLGKGSRYTA